MVIFHCYVSSPEGIRCDSGVMWKKIVGKITVRTLNIIDFNVSGCIFQAAMLACKIHGNGMVY